MSSHFSQWMTKRLGLVVEGTIGSFGDDPERAVSSVLITFGIVDLAGCMGAGMKINDWALEEEQGEDDDIY